MNFDFDPFFNKYQSIVELADKVFQQIKIQHPEELACRQGCSDCCYALFDLSLVEALYINRKFNERFREKEKEAIIELASKADRKIYKIKKQAFKDLKAGKNEVEIMSAVSFERVRCPLLDKEDMCRLYDSRPITCRIYGAPTSISGMSHTCGSSGFKEGTQYPTINIGVLQHQLYEISTELVSALKTKYKKMGDMLIPLSMALLTEYDESYLGIVVNNNKQQKSREGI